MLPTVPLPPKKHTLLLVSVISLTFLFIGIIFFLFTKPGQKIINRVFPDAERTVRITSQKLQQFHSYAIESSITRNTRKTTVSGITIPSRGSLWQASLLAENEKTNVEFPENGITTQIQIDGDRVYAKDPYDGTYNAANTSALPLHQIEAFRLASAYAMLQWAHENVSTSTIQKENNILHITIPKIPLNISERFRDNAESLPSQKTVLSINLSTYELQSFHIEWENSEKKTTTMNGSFTEFSTDTSKHIESIEANKFGDFLARESVYIRTNPDGAHDLLWTAWEQEYFQCTRCVNKYWDNDEDGLYNIQEFIFGSNPKMADSDGDTINDRLQVASSTHPTHGASIPPSYKKAIDLILLDFDEIATMNQGVKDTSTAYLGNAKIRDGFRELTLTPLVDIKTIQFSYALSGGPENNPYLTVFLDDKLLFTATPVPGEEKAVAENYDKAVFHKASVQIEQKKGEKVHLGFILNSFGGPGGEMLISDIGINDRNPIDLTPLLPKD